MSTPLSLFISYAHEDEAALQKLGKHLSSLQRERLITGWYDRQIAAGADWEREIKDNLLKADIILLLISADFTGSEYCVSIEAALAVDRWKSNQARLIPVILRAVDWKTLPLGNGTSVMSLGLLNALPKDGLPVRKWADEDEAFENIATGLRLVINEIYERRERAALDVAADPVAAADTPRPAAAPPPPAAAPVIRDAVHIALDKLAPFLESDSITWFIGPRASSVPADAQSRTCHIARSLLAELELVDREWERLLPPVDVAGSYYAAKNGITRLVTEVTRFMTDPAAPLPAVHRDIATLVGLQALLAQENDRRALRRTTRSPQIIVSTSLDLMMERALLAAGLPFTRLVQYHGEPKLEVAEFKTVVRLGDGKVGLQSPDGRSPGLMATAHTADLNELDLLLGAVTPRIETVQDSSGSHTNNQNPLASLSLKELATPILYKVRGSVDVPDSCAVSTEQYLEFCLNMASYFVPTQIGAIVQQTPAVFLGYSYLDPDFRLVYYTFLRALTEMRKDDRKLYSVQLSPDREPGDNYRRMEIPIWEDLKESGPRRAKITTIESEPESFVERFIARVDPTGARREKLAEPSAEATVRG